MNPYHWPVATYAPHFTFGHVFKKASNSSEEKQESIFDQESLILDSCGGSVYSYMNLKVDWKKFS